MVFPVYVCRENENLYLGIKISCVVLSSEVNKSVQTSTWCQRWDLQNRIVLNPVLVIENFDFAKLKSGHVASKF